MFKTAKNIIVAVMAAGVLTILLMSVSAAYAEEVSLTLNDAVMIALRENRDILLKAQDVKNARLKIDEARASLFPTLDLALSYNRYIEYLAKDFGQILTQTTLKEYLYKGGKTVNTIKYNEYGLIVQQAILDKAKIETILEVKKAFYALLLAYDYAALNNSILENTKKHLILVKERYKSGQASWQDIISIEASLSDVEEVYQASLNQLESAQALLGNFLYLENDARIRPQSEFILDDKEVAYDEALLKALSARPEIKQYEARIEADKKNIEIEKAGNRPSVYASWDYYKRSHLAATTSKGWNDHNIAGVTLSWPMFDGWVTKAKVEQAIVDLKESQLLREKAIKDIALELKKAYIGLKDALSKIESNKSEVYLYKDTFSTVSDKYKQGIASSLDLDDASLKYGISLFNREQAIYDYTVAKANFEKATGGK